ncbi:Leishmanolysin zinc metalloendopeptidase [Rubrivivax sp. A210]|uniref:leishmanolysin-related zinc metalloendopeptidase n=1 Tax=Rubrivivax sp. A210 TaxID=2772301 RepID=UPI00191A52CF|nr:leishmanolysin-related zinc metalloendopeptidase [Rubrivivax sp. A210]CAD5374221.1 Leishmanolysin zinc metalloendopeptidase [Rubrivivax sp. A210]
MKFTPKLIAIAALCAASAGAQAAFTINLSFTGLTATQESYFTAAKSFWEGVITGYVGSATLGGLVIDASGQAIDGVGGVLGSAGPTGGVFSGGYAYATDGVMQFDTADIDSMIAAGSFTDVIRHEMAHTIGFGTVWDLNNVYVDGSGQYTGAHALAAYRVEYNQPGATFVPVELGGSPGTANSHWNEVDNGTGNTGLIDPQGRDMRRELMTGWLNTPAYLSATTLASFQDIGYVLALSPVPEPAPYALLLAGMAVVALRRRHG